MTWTRVALAIGIVATAMVLARCAAPAPNRDGWWDAGIHEVDGYWVIEESPCSPETDESCKAAFDAAVAALHANQPGAVVTRTVGASFPRENGDAPHEVTFTFAGLSQPRLVILDLADGSRRAIGLQCGPETVDGRYPVPVCHGQEHELFRVGGS